MVSASTIHIMARTVRSGDAAAGACPSDVEVARTFVDAAPAAVEIGGRARLLEEEPSDTRMRNLG
ncbi:MAG: hypothetical protein AAFR55_06195 [Pseudomonadota bacterium]